MNRLEYYIQPEWTMRPLTKDEKEAFGSFKNEDWVHIDCKVNCYGDVSEGRAIWIRSDWLDVAKRGFYRA